MGRKVLVGLLAFSMLVLMTGMAAAEKQEQEKANMANPEHLYLYEKNSTWDIVEDGAWGKMTYSDESFVFNGHGLEAATDYTLIYYPNPWPGNGLMCLGDGTSNNGGNVNIKGDFNFTAIPIPGDTNAPGAKIWLVLSDDVDCVNQHIIVDSWHPTSYLFEYDLI